ncbi:MAG: hypothetical protein A3A33_01380 [Candidatus Yanofskybacteria bacterium RIFCSPLOWO2_01_FULL_49_25]|uniref:Xylose isomerase-like TIM barrel domain-containing protein n=1 Tax=Candidatus Yanofskybacteria bacterium RIFCSPLOWO2_01_FULL_49_25 TaxID=1802701 RepID=A0A1F8GZA2_9BACT|nr:MAG: hypothetical protein A3A33_01380 [Candidatus Yanofskybacteria bacterium RIFCSPLOWO2_01_FULL_49_25]
MIKLVIPFLLTDYKQIPPQLLNGGYYLEGDVFDTQQLIDRGDRLRIEKNISYLVSTYPNQLINMHFPNEHADYLSSRHLKKLLIEFLALGAQYGVQRIILHANCIRPLISFDGQNLNKLRDKYVLLYETLNHEAEKQNIQICIENMPLIGNEGNDFDSIFVFPSDFKKIKYSHIKINWDIGHWAYTLYMLNLISSIHPTIQTPPDVLDDFFKLKDSITNMHFSSFRGVAFPKTGLCKEGYHPRKGDFEEKALQSLMRRIHAWKKEIPVTLEIQDTDYHNRQELLETVNWFKKSVFTSRS